jgi:hypothetical protein
MTITLLVGAGVAAGAFTAETVEVSVVVGANAAGVLLTLGAAALPALALRSIT